MTQSLEAAAQATEHQLMLFALDRVATDLEQQVKRMAAEGDYNCQFPESEAASLRRAIALLSNALPADAEAEGVTCAVCGLALTEPPTVFVNVLIGAASSVPSLMKPAHQACVPSPFIASPPSPDRTQGQHRPELLPVDWRDFPSNNADMVSFVEHRCMAHYLKGRTDGIAHVAAQAPIHGLRYTQSAVDLMLAMRDQKHADALAVLKELVACQDLFDSVAYRSYRGTIYPDQLNNDRIELKSRQPLAWAEARRVIADTGEKG